MTQQPAIAPSWIRVPHRFGKSSYDCVKIDVHIVRVSDAVERIYATEGILEYGDTLATFIWEDGNFACDCNRYLFFQRAGEEPEGDYSCSDGQYKVWITNPADGRILYDER